MYIQYLQNIQTFPNISQNLPSMVVLIMVPTSSYTGMSNKHEYSVNDEACGLVWSWAAIIGVAAAEIQYVNLYVESAIILADVQIQWYQTEFCKLFFQSGPGIYPQFSFLFGQHIVYCTFLHEML